ncbi:hypothetical protein BDQ12DRAFT_619015 [Crucibulum laeve]|uniref:Uncharacterized protein n=1 Tax=Crucibulum laeve TaxID=68775 RepID=A0A5C3LEX5_9AGAR|nr:hypothetical protein BDQ12DRAFT_619015 [Crucibulum laeve]
MFSLIRRISHSVIPRPDKPWEDDPTSNAPAKRRKRRLSSTERDVDAEDEQSRKKKHRGESAAASDAEEPPATPLLLPETKDVKEVREGVEEVDLSDKKAEDEAVAVPASIPLPEEKSGELDEPVAAAATVSTSPPEMKNVVDLTSVKGSAEESTDSPKEVVSTEKDESVKPIAEKEVDTTVDSEKSEETEEATAAIEETSHSKPAPEEDTTNE